MLPTIVLYLREGLEASLIVSILLAVLRQMNLMHQARAVWVGVILAVLGSLLGAAALYMTVRIYDDTLFETIFETVTYLIAVVLLTTMTFWMQQHSRTLKKEIMTKAGVAGSGFALGLLAFTTVGREGLETAFFTLAFAFQSSNILELVLGALIGVLLAIGLCFLIYRMGYRLNYRIFFRVMGLLLLLFAAGLLGNAIQNMQLELHWIPFGTTVLWDTSHILPEEGQIGSLLHGIFGYSDAPTLLHVLAYVAFLLIFGAIFWRMTGKHESKQPVQTTAVSSDTAAKA